MYAYSLDVIKEEEEEEPSIILEKRGAMLLCKRERTNLTLVGDGCSTLDTRPDSHRRWFSYADAQSIVFRSMRNQHFFDISIWDVMLLSCAVSLSPPSLRNARGREGRGIGNQSLPSISSPEMALPHFHENGERVERDVYYRQHHGRLLIVSF